MAAGRRRDVISHAGRRHRGLSFDASGHLLRSGIEGMGVELMSPWAVSGV